MQAPDVKHLRAVVVLAEERNFSRTASRLRIGQSGLTKQIVAVESYLGFQLFHREPKGVRLTQPGEIFIAEARIALEHLDRAINLSRSSSKIAGLTIHVGKTPYTDPYLITKLLSLRLPLFPSLKIQLTSKLTNDLTHDLLDNTLDLCFLTEVADNPRLSGTIVADQSFWVAMRDTEGLADQHEVSSEDLQARSCIVFERHVQSNVYDRLIKLIRPASRPGCSLHCVMTAEDAMQLLLRGFGVALLSQADAWRSMHSGVTIRPFKCQNFSLKTQLVARADNDSKLVSDVVRGLIRSLHSTPPAQIRLPLHG